MIAINRLFHSRIGLIVAVAACMLTSAIVVEEGAAQSVAAAAKKRRADSAPRQAHDEQLTGKVVETMDGGGYTYVRIEAAGEKVWVAIPQTPVQVGSPLTLHPQLTLEKFESKALKQTFDRIVFATVITSPDPQPSHPAVTGAADAASHMSVAEAEVARVEKAEGGRTVAELWSSRKELDGSVVIVRGKVVKSMQQVMSRNWIHLRDGSGSRAEGTDDITVTTSDAVPAGSIVTFRGTLRVDKDFGSGYRYAVLVEEATLIP